MTCRLHLATAKATWKPLASKVLRRPGTLLLIAAVRSSQRHWTTADLWFLAVRLTSSPAHSDPEVSRAALRALEKQQRRGCYWTLIAVPEHTVWSSQGVGRLLSSSHAHVTQAEERVTANHEWLAQPTPEATPTGLAYRVRRVVRELEPTRFRRERLRPPRAPACGTGTELQRSLPSTKPTTWTTSRTTVSGAA